jgi:acyl-CoA synthetase (AMP-forming)/AMP-acid ligase II
MIIGDLLVRSANKFPHKTAVVSETRFLTFRELNDRVNRLANWLLDAGLSKGDRIGVLVHNGATPSSNSTLLRPRSGRSFALTTTTSRSRR